MKINVKDNFIYLQRLFLSRENIHSENKYMFFSKSIGCLCRNSVQLRQRVMTLSAVLLLSIPLSAIICIFFCWFKGAGYFQKELRRKGDSRNAV